MRPELLIGRGEGVQGQHQQQIRADDAERRPLDEDFIHRKGEHPQNLQDLGDDECDGRRTRGQTCSVSHSPHSGCHTVAVMTFLG